MLTLFRPWSIGMETAAFHIHKIYGFRLQDLYRIAYVQGFFILGFFVCFLIFYFIFMF